jgi:hypothetical protein
VLDVALGDALGDAVADPHVVTLPLTEVTYNVDELEAGNVTTAVDALG